MGQYDNVVAVILGGGAGSRLFPLTHERSKPAVPLGGTYREQAAITSVRPRVMRPRRLRLPNVWALSRGDGEAGDVGCSAMLGGDAIIAAWIFRTRPHFVHEASDLSLPCRNHAENYRTIFFS